MFINLAVSEKLAAGNDGEISAIGLQLSFRCPVFEI